MDVATSFAFLGEMHPDLEWQEIAHAAVAVLEDRGLEAPFQIPFELINVPGFGSGPICMMVDRAGYSSGQVTRIRRTYEVPRRVELAAIALAGLALYHGGSHEIVDVAIRGSGADYLVGSSLSILEVAGRSRRADFETAWQQKQQRLGQRAARGCYVCVVEFETPTGRLAYWD